MKKLNVDGTIVYYRTGGRFVGETEWAPQTEFYWKDSILKKKHWWSRIETEQPQEEPFLSLWIDIETDPALTKQELKIKLIRKIQERNNLIARKEELKRGEII